MEHDPEHSPYGDLIRPTPGDEEPGPDELRAIVARAGRRRWRAVAGVAAAALLAGGGAGYALAGSGGSSHPNTAAISPSSGSRGTSGGYSSSTSGVMVPATPEHLTHLFNRIVGDVTVRGFSYATTGGVNGCFAGPRFQAEVSTPAMVGTSDAINESQGALGVSVWASVDGEAEGAPVLVVTVSSGPDVTQVRAEFVNGATDEMTPVKGWSALVTPMSSAMANAFAANPLKSMGTLVATTTSGSVTEPIENQAQMSPALYACAPILACGEASSGSSGSESSGSGSSGGPVTTVTVPCPANASPALTLPPGLSTVRPSCTTSTSIAKGSATYSCTVSGSRSSSGAG